MKILLIAYYYPPLGGPASIRLGKSVKYLRSFGVEVDVLTVNNIVYHSYDYDLMEECKPDDIVKVNSCELLSLLYSIVKLRSLFFKSNKIKCSNRSYFSLSAPFRSFLKGILPVDDKIGWLLPALRRAKKMVKIKQYNLIIASVAPHTSALIAYYLSKKSKIPLLLDFRDHWSLNPYNHYLTPLHRKTSYYFEKKAVYQSSLMTFVGNKMREEMLAKYPKFEREKTEVIYNGYDEADFTSVKTKEEDKIVILYTGSLYQQRSPENFLNALCEIKNTLSPKLRVRFIGNYHPEMLKLLENKNLSGIVELVPQISHKESVVQMLRSDILLLLIPSDDGQSVITSKIFEYIRSGKKIIAMIPENSEAAELLKSYEQVYICNPDNIEEIKYKILQAIASGSKKIKHFDMSKYSRESQSRKLLQFIKSHIDGSED